jgi:hypothetical protein
MVGGHHLARLRDVLVADAVRIPRTHYLSKCARQLGLSWDFFDARHETMRSVFGMAKLHRLSASPMQSDRSSAVGLKPANEAVENKLKREPTMITPKSPLRIFVMMTVSFVLEWRTAPRIS